MENERTLTEQVDAVVAAHPFGRASAAKRGRRKEWPYVPIIDFGLQSSGCHMTRTEQIRAKAFATREDAVDYAQRTIDARKAAMRARLLEPRFRAFRQQAGLPVDI